MMSIRGLLPVSILFLFCLGNVGKADESKQDAPRWLSDWEEGRRAARASGKPLFVVFRCQH
jgi:hypothetical protein